MPIETKEWMDRQPGESAEVWEYRKEIGRYYARLSADDLDHSETYGDDETGWE